MDHMNYPANITDTLEQNRTDTPMDCFNLGKSVAYNTLRGNGEHVPDVAHEVGWELAALYNDGYSEEELEMYATIRARVLQREELYHAPEAVRARIEAEAAAEAAVRAAEEAVRAAEITER